MRTFFAGLISGVILTSLLLKPQDNRAAQAQATTQSASTITLLYDPKALEALRNSGGLQVIWWRKEAQVVSLGQPRWIIPAKVQPQIAGDSSGAEYYYFDQKTGRKDGPFKPAKQ